MTDEREVDIYPLSCLTAPFTIAVIDYDFVNQFIGHGSSQMVEILILAYKAHEPSGLARPISVIINGRSQCADFLLKDRAFAFILIAEDKPIKLLLKQLVFILLIIINEICGKSNCALYFCPELSPGCGKLPNICSWRKR